MSMLRDEMLYFWPQLETKIMNEGWATYWHQRIVRELDLTSEETIEYAKLNAAVVQPSRYGLNPYYLGLKIFEDIERRWNDPTPEERERFGREPGKGREKLFEVREFDSDASFIRNYLTRQLVEELDLYVFEKKGEEWKITEKSWETVRDQLVYSRVNGGFPYIVVEDGNHANNGELYLKHRYEGIELDLKYLEKTLPYVHRLWGKTVHLETVVEEKPMLFTYDGKKHSRKFL
jgi:stage V sporulation protein R